MRKYFLLVSCMGCFAAFAQTDTVGVDTLPPDIIPVFTIAADALENETQSQDVSGLLQSSKDVFTNIAGFNFSSARFRLRGLSSENNIVTLNGVPMNDPESGWAIWSVWGGLNDITRYQDSRTGIAASQYTFGGLSGFSNIDVRASTLRAGTKVSQAVTNRTYRFRTMVTHNTGVMENGLAVSVSASARWANEGYVQGTYYSAASYFLSVEKILNDKHSIGIVGFGAPTIQGRAGLAVQEAYDLTGSNYYNPYWGYQNGEVRNARIRNNHKPVVMLFHYFTPSANTTVNTTFYGQFGRGGQTNLNWYDAADPRPDYYKYLPSYYAETDPALAAQMADAWQNDEASRQLDWDQFYFANGKNLYTVNNANGIAGNNITGMRSKYIVEEYRTDPTLIGVNSILNTRINDNLIVIGGLNYNKYVSKNFKVLEDLLGGDFWVDVDQFAEQDFTDPTVAQNDLNNSNAVIEQGDKFGYNYDINVNRGSVFGQAEYTLSKMDVYVGISASSTQFWRTGNFRNGRFPESSFGDSEKQNFFNYGLKAGAVYKLTGRHMFSANVMYGTRAPQVKNSFLSPRTRNLIVNGLTSEQIMGMDVSYHIRYPKLKLRATWYYNEINNQTWARSFWHDELRTFVNYTMTGVNHLYTGVEFGIEAQVTTAITLTGAFSKGDFLWNSRPTATITADNTSEVLAEDRTVYFKNYRLGGMPQTAANVGFKYSSAKFWFGGFNVNYYDEIWLDANPDRRTSEALEGYLTTDPQWNDIIDQTKLDAAYTVDVFAGKSFKIGSYYLLIMFNASNVLNNTDIITGGFEQLRYDSKDIDKFPPKFGYMYGTTYYGMIRLSF